jgi:biopolymer transport protein ExbD
MAIDLRGPDEDGDALVAAINTTPLVDIMLVLLIIFLITVPVVTHSVPVALPHETNQPSKTRPADITIAVDKQGDLYWNEARLDGNAALLQRLKDHAADDPQPAVHIRADKDVRYEAVGRVVADCQRAGISKVSFIVEQDRGSAAAARVE